MITDQFFYYFRIGAVTTDQPVLTEQNKIARFCFGRFDFCGFLISIKVIVFYSQGIIKDVSQIKVVKAGFQKQLNIKVFQQFVIPVSGYPVESKIEFLFFLYVRNINKVYGNGCISQVFCYLETEVSGNNNAVSSLVSVG